MSAKRYWPVVTVGALAVALFFSNRSAALPGGGDAVFDLPTYNAQRTKMEELSLASVKKFDQGGVPTADEMKKLRQAADIADRLIEFEPTRSALFFLSGKIHHILGEDSIAEERFAQNLDVATNDGLRHPEERQIIDETAAESAYQLSLLRISHGDAKGALVAADYAVKTVIAPQYIVARASALTELRRIPEAKKDLETALKLDPNNTRAKGLLNFISKG